MDDIKKFIASAFAEGKTRRYTIYIYTYIYCICVFDIYLNFFNFNFLCVVVAGSLNWFSFLVALLNVPKKKRPSRCRKELADFCRKSTIKL